MKLLVFIENQFNDIELTTPLSYLKRADENLEITYYHPHLSNAHGQYNISYIQNISNQIGDLDSYDAFFIPGGKGAQSLRKNEHSLKIISTLIAQNKLVFAICDAPNVLLENNLIPEKFTYSSFPSNWSATYQNSFRSEEMVSRANNLITGRCAFASNELGLTMVEILYGKETANLVSFGMTGNK